MPGGILLIIDNAEGRTGSENDCENLRVTFEGMGARVIVKKNPTADKTREIISEFKTMDFRPYLYVAIAFLSHGGENSYAQTPDKKLIHIQKTILIPLCKKPELDGKLKWLIMQTCRGSYDFLTQVSEGPEDGHYPRYYLKFFATTEGTRAYRAEFSNETGSMYESFFIKALCARLRNEYATRDLMSIIGDVRNDVVQMRISQTPAVEDNLNGRLFSITKGLVN